MQKVAAHQLPPNFFQALEKLYVIKGEEPQQSINILQKIRAQAKIQGYNDRRVIETDAISDELITELSSLSLFSTGQLVELRLTHKLPKQGVDCLLALTTNIPEHLCVVLAANELDRSVYQTKWFKTLIQQAVVIDCFKLQGHQLQQWIQKSAQQLEITLPGAGAARLAKCFTGNLPAIQQTLEKLSLLGLNQPSVEDLQELLAADPRFSVFELIDFCLQGEAQETLTCIQSLKIEGVQPTLVLWAITREIRTLLLLHEHINNGQPATQAMNALGIWRSRQNSYQKALQNLNVQHLLKLHEAAASADKVIKGFHKRDVWDMLTGLCLSLVGHSYIFEEETPIC